MFHVLHDNEDSVSLVIARYLMDLDDVLMVDGLKDGDFSQRSDGKILSLGQFQFLYCHYMISVLVLGTVNHSVGSFMYSIQFRIVIDINTPFPQSASNLFFFLMVFLYWCLVRIIFIRSRLLSLVL